MSDTNVQTAVESLVSEFTKLVEAGNEEATKDFLAEHIKEFPEPAQQKIIFAFFKEALEKESDAVGEKATFQKEAMSVLDSIEKEQKDLGDKKKEIEIKESLGA